MEIYDERQGKYINVPRDQASAWVPALPDKRPSVAYPVVDGALGAPGQHSDGRALEALPGVVETATPFWRAVALVIRTIAPALIITGMVLMAAWIAGADEQIAAGILVAGAILVGGFWFITDKAERRDSAAGVEHHKIDEAAALAELREANQHERATKLLDNYIKMLERD